MEISLVVSTRDNLKYLKWSYESIRKNQGDHEVWICIAVDHCTDGTQEWIEEIKKTDPHVRSIENKTGKRLGITIMCDRVINEIVHTEIAMMFHSDMYLCPGALDAIEGLMYFKYPDVTIYSGPPDNLPYLVTDRKTPEQKRIVSLTRIEPPLHPPGPEKIVLNCGTEPEDFDEYKLIDRIEYMKERRGQSINANTRPMPETTNGVFAPWAFWVDEFKAIGGHDELFAPQSKEDSDIFNRFKLNGCEFIQTWQGFVYHLTCRGSRYNPNITTVGVNSPEWERQNNISARNFIRKWGHYVQHDEFLHPIIPSKYRVIFKVENCNIQFLSMLEPWCDTILTDLSENIVLKYIAAEQPLTKFQLQYKIDPQIIKMKENMGVIVEIDCRRFTKSDFDLIQNLSSILDDSGDLGEFEMGNLRLLITSMQTYEKDLIVCKNEKVELN